MIAKCVKLLIAKSDHNSPNRIGTQKCWCKNNISLHGHWASIISIISHGYIAGSEIDLARQQMHLMHLYCISLCLFHFVMIELQRLEWWLPITMDNWTNQTEIWGFWLWNWCLYTEGKLLGTFSNEVQWFKVFEFLQLIRKTFLKL